MSVRVSSRVGLLAWLLAVALALCGCVTPTLPPDDPPAPDEVELGVGVAHLRGRVNTGPAFVLVLNRVSGLLFGQQTADGFYDFEVRTEPCDALALWYTVGTFQSSAVTFRPAEVNGPRGVCSGVPELPADAGDLP
jgi:hypothetical protein